MIRHTVFATKLIVKDQSLGRSVDIDARTLNTFLF
jgi:hypothetical protein